MRKSVKKELTKGLLQWTKEFNKEKKEHPNMTRAQVVQIVRDHRAKKRK
jgi:hypothetical protein